MIWIIGAVAPASWALPHNIPDFSADGSRPTVRSVQSGNWSSGSTWSTGQVPTANHVVHVDPGHVVTIDNTAAVAYTIAVHGTLRFNPSVNTRLKVTNLMVMGDHGMPSMTTVGYLEVGTAAAPIAANVTAEIIIANASTGGGVADPEQFGTGILNFGKMTMHGSAMDPTWLRVAAEPRAGHTTLTLSQPVSGWRVGDRLMLPDTRHIKWNETPSGSWTNLQNQWEERTIQSISPDNHTVTLNSALTFDHLGARDLNGALDFLPHVGNLTRNVIVRSESATGTRGHTISVHIADTDIRYALFKDLGRTKYTPLNTTTNVIGRYPIHMHHNQGPRPTPANGYQFTLIGNAVDGGSVETQFKWGIAVHNSHYGLIQHNVVYNYNGASIATEDGSESFNVFDHNFAVRGMGEPDNSVSEARTAMGTEGVGFWFRGPNNYIRNNVAANFQNPTAEAAYGFVFMVRLLGNVAIPTFPGADPAIAGQFTTVNANNTPILQFENNEAYGATQGALTFWWIGSQDPQPYSTARESIIKDFKAWNTFNKVIYIYPSAKVTLDGLKVRGQYGSDSRCCGDAVHFSDYSASNIIIRNADIQGMNSGVDAPASGMWSPIPNLLIENSYLRNWSNINVPTPSSVNGCWMSNKLVTVNNTRLEAPPGRSLQAISMDGPIGGAIECLLKLDEVRVYAHNGNASDNFQVYATRTAVLPRPPGSCTPTTKPGISSGVTCPIAPIGGSLPTATFSASPQTINSGQSATLTWSTSGATAVSINQGIGTVTTSGTRTVSPAATTTYTLTATNANGSVTQSVTVTVSSGSLPTATFSAAPATINSGQSATLSWTTSAATSVSINQGVGTVALSGTRAVSPTVTTTYTLTATNANGSVTKTATVTVGGGGSVPTATLSGSPLGISTGQSSTLSWTTANATSVSINQGIGTVGASGTRSVSPAATTTYTLTATNANGSTTSAVTVTVNAPSGLSGDFNGDSVPDVLSYNASSGAWSIYIAGLGTVLSGSWPAGLVLYAIKLDANNLADVFGYNPTAGTLLSAVNTGTTLATSTAAWWPGWQVYVLDVDGIGADQVFLGNGAGRLIPVVSALGPSRARPWISPDGLRLYFASNRASGSSRLDLFVASRLSGSSPFTSLVPVAGVNSSASSGGPTLTPDELTIFYWSNASGGNDLWMASRSSKTAAFSTPIPVGPVNSPADELDPEISPDGTTLFFESNRPGGLGGTDVWASVRESAAGPFAPPVNFAALNSSMNDGHPGINSDTAHLYFASDRPGANTAQTWRKRLTCDSVNPTTINLPRAGGLQSIAIADASSCGWVALTPQSWLVITSAASGNGGGAVTVGAAANPGATRSGTIRIGGRTVTITQKGLRSKGPQNLDASVEGSTVTLRWQPPAEEPSAEPGDQPLTYVLEAGSASGTSDIVPGFATQSLATAATFQGVPNGTYYVRSRVLYPDYQSEPSNEIAITVGNGSCAGLPSVPANLSYSVEGSLVTLTWNASSGSVNSYLLSAGYAPGQFPLQIDTGTNNPRFSAHAPPGIYYVRVRGRNHCGIGSGADIVVVVP
jgi:PKD repeat protein